MKHKNMINFPCETKPVSITERDSFHLLLDVFYFITEEMKAKIENVVKACHDSKSDAKFFSLL